MCDKFLILTLCLAVGCWAKPADIVARVPSDFYYGTKWVLFRDDSIPDPPPNVIQAENNVQVLPTYRYHQQQPQHYYQSLPSVTPSPVHVTSTSLHVTPTSVHVEDAPVAGDHDTEVVESKSAAPKSYYNFDYEQHQQQPHQEQRHKVVKVTTYGVTAVPHTSVHVEGPAYYLRKKKNA